ncbi:hypothetical protein PanWU01x14_008280 [Parasponia andersonii]|uniref:Uncharacterized protein n=1 Tax=Parasponia andersonii TaxID=3476 RepID=A0A2P5E225_PARAD|nr:hypothetical protein PanWU01x14_008280 [Parasponia andersonii]
MNYKHTPNMLAKPYEYLSQNNLIPERGRNRQLLTGAELEAESGRKTKLEPRRIQRWWWHSDRKSDGGTAGEKPFRWRNLPATGGDLRQQHPALVRQRLPVTADRRVWHGGGRWRLG